MQDNFEKLIRLIYRRWKLDQHGADAGHPEEDDLACFFAGNLSQEESARIKAHLLTCDNCAEIASIQAQLKEGVLSEHVPGELAGRIKKLVIRRNEESVLGIVLRLRDDVLELIETTGVVVLGGELVPVPVLRARKIKDFKDEIIILKDFKDIKVEIKIENRAKKSFNFSVAIQDKQSQQLLRDLRIALLKDDLELESRLTDSGRVIFEDVRVGRYTIEISNLNDKIASVLLELKK